MLYVTFKGFDVLFDFDEVCEALLDCVASGVLFYKADSFIILITKDEALAHIRGETGNSFQFGFLALEPKRTLSL